MDITFPCTGCGRNLRVPSTIAAARARCPRCGSHSPVPPPERQLRNEVPTLEEDAAALLLGRPTSARAADPGQGASVAVLAPAPARLVSAPQRVGPAINRDLLRQYRRSAHGVGGFTVALGVFQVILGIVFLFCLTPSSRMPGEMLRVVGALALVEATGWLVGGIFVLLKRRWAILLILTLGSIKITLHLLAMLNGMGVSGLGVAIGLIIVSGATNTWELSGKLQSAGIALDTPLD